jgi:hypothetical protein
MVNVRLFRDVELMKARAAALILRRFYVQDMRRRTFGQQALSDGASNPPAAASNDGYSPLVFIGLHDDV